MVKDILRVWIQIFGNWKYLILMILTIVIAVLFYSLNVLIPNYETLLSFYSILGFFGTLELFFTFMRGFRDTIQLHSYISLITISILFGMLISLVGFKFVAAKDEASSKKAGLFGGFGLFLGALAPGCAACGVGLLSLLGLSTAFITFLPLDGLEFSILAIGLLGFSIFKISKDLTVCKVCRVNLNLGKHLNRLELEK